MPVTFLTALEEATTNNDMKETLNDCNIDEKLETITNSLTNQTDDNINLGYIEEKKIFVKGIKVRAAKISKLVQILMDSFGKNIK